jgi:4a-hydroxytetrahydrobiopterin dehydratase
MAKFCDEQAAAFGEVESEKVNEVGKELADTGASAGGDCCVPKKKET